MNYIKFTALAILLISVFSFIPTVSAELLSPNTKVELNKEIAGFGMGAGYNTDSKNTTIEQKIGQVIQIALGFVGTLFLLLIIVSGFQWMMAGGNSTTIEAAKKRLINATIGLAIVLAAYSITWFVTEQVLGVTGVIELQEETLQ